MDRFNRKLQILKTLPNFINFNNRKNAIRHGIMISTYGSIPYVHLNLELLKRTGIKCPLLIHDDNSSCDFSFLSKLYKCHLFKTEKRFGQGRGYVGDFVSYINGMEWAYKHKINIFWKISRRLFVFENFIKLQIDPDKEIYFNKSVVNYTAFIGFNLKFNNLPKLKATFKDYEKGKHRDWDFSKGPLIERYFQNLSINVQGLTFKTEHHKPELKITPQKTLILSKSLNLPYKLEDFKI